ncbi:MAG: NUDIX hydrolase [Patescibacteria group bacterium]
MTSINLDKLNDLRKQGFRPVVVAAIVKNYKILMFYHKKYSVWMLPQGGISSGELPQEALQRELSEEINYTFVENLRFPAKLFHEHRLKFPRHQHGSRTLFDDSGVYYEMKGKHYLFHVLEAIAPVNTLAEEFDDAAWLGYENARNLVLEMPQKNKKDIILKLLDMLVSANYIK